MSMLPNRGQHGFFSGRRSVRGEWGFILALLWFLPVVRGADSGSIDVTAVIRHSVEATTRDWLAAPNFDFYETDEENNGNKTYEEKMILGSRYQMLVAVDGVPLSAAGKQEESRKLQEAIVARERETPQERARRIQHYETERKRNHLLMGELTKAFRFKLKGETRLEGHDVYVLQATPLPGYVPPSREAQVLKGMQGTLWIDKQSFQWVKVEAEVVHPVSIAGFLARVDPGTQFELEKMPIAGDIWLPKHFAMRSNAKVLFFFHRQGQADETYSNYHPVESYAAASAPAPGRKK